jgi:hypothetical protein
VPRWLFFSADFLFFSSTWIDHFQFKFQHPNWIWTRIDDPATHKWQEDCFQLNLVFFVLQLDFVNFSLSFNIQAEFELLSTILAPHRCQEGCFQLFFPSTWIHHFQLKFQVSTSKLNLNSYLQPLQPIGAQRFVLNLICFFSFSSWLHYSKFKFQHPKWIWTPIHDPFTS